jgi:hypothetical protein
MSRQVFAALKFRATVFIGVCSLAAPVVAQSSLPVSVDQRVRVETAGTTVTGRVLSVTPDGLRLAADEQAQVTIAAATVRRVEVSRGQTSRGASAKKWAIRGAVISGVLGAISLGLQHETVGENGSSVGKAAALGAWSGGLFGGLIGAGIGASRGGDRWEQVWP